MPRPARLAALVAGALLALTARAADAQTGYTSEADFLAALMTTGANSLDDVPITDPIAVVTDLSFGFTTAGLAAPSGDPGDASLGFALSGSGQSWTQNDGITRVQFVSAVNGFGAQFFDFGTLDDIVFRFFSGATEVGTQTFTAPPRGYDGFYGVTLAAGFDRVDIESAPQEYYEMDELRAGVGLVGATVPEPSTVALLGAAGVALLALRRRRPALATGRGATHA